MDATDIVYISAEVIVGLITVVGNSLVLAAIVKTRRLHTITNVFVGNLAIADIAVGVLVAPCAALSFMGLPKDFYGCVFINCLILMFTNVSILMLLSVAVERFLAIKEPFLYHRLLTVRRAICVNICVWILGSVLGLMPMYGWHGGYRVVMYCRFTDVVTYQYMVYFQFFGLVLLPLFIMLCIYIYILIIVRRHLRQTNALHNRFQQNSPTTDGFSKDVRAAKMFALVILMFGIFWFPVNIFNCVSLFCGMDCGFPKQALLAAIVMSHANSSINPFLYATSNSRIKGAIKELFGFKLSPDERSSTDHNNARNVTNGTPRARENIVSPIFHAEDSSSYKDDVPSNIVSHAEFLPGMAELPLAPRNEFQEGDSGIVLNDIKQAVNNNNIRQSFNVNGQSRNHSTHSSNISLSLLPELDRPTEQKSLTPQHKGQQYLQNVDTNYQTFVQLSIISQLSPLSCEHTVNNQTCINLCDNGHPNLAFVDAESFKRNEDECNGISTCDQMNGSMNLSLSDNHSRRPSDVQDIWNGTDLDTVEPVIIYRHFSNGPYQLPRLSKLYESESPIQSNEILIVRTFNERTLRETTHSSIDCRRTDGSEKFALCVNCEEEMNTDYKVNNEIHTGQQTKTNTAFKPLVFDEFGILRNAKTEHTKL